MYQAHELIRDIENITRTIKLKKGMLEGIQANCHHAFTLPKYDPIIQKGYSREATIPKNYDEVAWCQAVYVPDKVTDQWTRVCTLCGKIEHTTKVDVHTETTKTPKF